MSFPIRIPTLALCLIVTGSIRGAPTEPTTPAATTTAKSGPILSGHIHAEITRLVRQDAGITTAVPDRPAEAPGPQPVDEEIVVLAPMTVTERIPPDLTPPRETRAEVFFRTGTIAEHVGKKVTTRFWFASDKGLMLSFDF